MIVFHFPYLKIELENTVFSQINWLDRKKKKSQTFLVAMLKEILTKIETRLFLKHNGQVLGEKIPCFFLDK